MAFALRRPPLLRTKLLLTGCARGYASVQPVTLIGKPPGPPDSNAPAFAAPTALDSLILSRLRSSPAPALPTLIQQYDNHEGRVLDSSLPYDSRPSHSRKVNFDRVDVFADNGVVMVAHAVTHQDRHKVALCSGFALNIPAHEKTVDSDGPEQTVVVTCAHTLEEMRNSSILSSLPLEGDLVADISADAPHSGSFVLSGPPTRHAPVFHPVSSVLSSLHRADVLLLGISNKSSGSHAMPTLPVSPYPVQPGTAIRAHFVVDKEPNEPGWHPWVGGTWSKWVQGTVVGYRDFAGREAKPGTYDALSHLLFKPLPTPGSSGGPIIDEESGAVVGLMVGTRMDSEIDGVRGWGRPAETIFEMFSLPGLNLPKR